MITVGIYKKHLAFWAILGIVFLSGRAFINNQQSFADSTDLIVPSSEGESFQANLQISKDGSVLLNNKKASAKVTSLKNIDQLRVVLLDKTSQSITQSQVLVTLPNDISVTSLKVIPRLVHNFTSDVNIVYPTDHTILATTPYISGESTYSLEIDFPKGELNLPLITRLVGELGNYSLLVWLLIGSVLPALTLIVLVFLLQKHYRLRQVRANHESVDSPPTDIPPALVEVLLQGHISSRSIAATLIDLAHRGYLMIGYKDDNFRFGKHKNFALPAQAADPDNITAILQSVARVKDNTDIRLFERLILSKIFTSEELIIDREELELRVGHRLFSEKIASAYNEIYKEATKKNFFVEDPAVYHHQFKLIGLSLFFLGFGGFILGAIFFPDPKASLLTWVGMMIASYIIILISPRLPILSDQGLIAFRQWTLFKNYLSNPTPLFYSEKNKGQFENYLPYAIAMGVEKEWSARFREHPVIFPSWFISPQGELSLEEFDRELFPLVSWVSKHLSFARTPIID